MKKLIYLLDKVSLCGGLFAAFTMVAGTLLILTEVFVRTYLNSTTYIANEYPGYMCAAISSMGLGYTLSRKGHVRMTYAFAVFKGKLGIVWDILIHSLGLVFSACLVIVSWNFFYASYTNKTVSMQVSQTPLAIPQFFIVLGAVILFLQFISEICKLMLALKDDKDIRVSEGL